MNKETMQKLVNDSEFETLKNHDEVSASTLTALLWRDASTAPEDGTEFQGWILTEGGAGFWEPRCKLDEDGTLGIYGRVDYDEDGWDFGLWHLGLTHWMPHPSEP